jgi:hypothetical protein
VRDDLQEAIKRVIRVQHHFVEVLNLHAWKSDRIKSINDAVGEIPFHCKLQRKILDQGVLQILESKAARAKEAEKQAAAEVAKKKREEHDASCFACYTCANW